MNIKEYQRKQTIKQHEIVNTEYDNEIQKAILDIEYIICSISPFGIWWRYGFIKSLRIAIRTLKDEEKRRVSNEENNSYL